MDGLLTKLDECLTQAEAIDTGFNRTELDHGSHDQTRAMVIQSIMMQGILAIKQAIAQFEIIDSQLY